MTAAPALLGGNPVRMRPFPSWPRRTETSSAALLEVLESGHWWQSGGGKAEQIETWVAGYQGTRGAVAVSNGTHALEVSLRALGVGPGDNVLVPALTFLSSATAVSVVGATPIPVDIVPGTFCLDIEDALAKRTPSTRAIMPVHLAGQPVDMDAVRQFAAEAKLAVVEDAAQAIGAEWNGERVGGLGDAGTFSFQAGKLLSAGEGGAVVSNSQSLLQEVELLANCGRERGSGGYSHQLVGSNYRMSEFNAAVLLSQIDELEPLTEVRQHTAACLTEALLDQEVVDPPSVRPEVTRMVWYMYLIRVPPDLCSNSQFATALSAEGIPVSPIYPAYHWTRAYQTVLDEYRGSCPIAESAANEVVWLHHRLLLDGETGPRDIVAATTKIADNIGLLRARLWD